MLEARPLAAFPLVARWQYLLEYGTFGLVAGLLLVPVALPGPARTWPARVLSHPWAHWLGTISYGIFLWHYPVLVALSRTDAYGGVGAGRFWLLLAATLAVAVPCAAASYYLLERPLMRLTRRRRATAPADELAAP